MYRNYQEEYKNIQNLESLEKCKSKSQCNTTSPLLGLLQFKSGKTMG
jgi:hypothetical protein